MVMFPIAMGSFLMWYALGSRFYILRRGSTRSVRALAEEYMAGSDRKPRGLVDNAVFIGVEILRATSKRRRKLMTEAFFPIREIAKRHRNLAKTVVISAPLAGLLGTVAGMIEMFDSLAGQEFYSQSGGIAGGIAEALFTTQLGLTVAVPGLIIGRILERKEEAIHHDIDQVVEMICALEKEEDKEEPEEEALKHEIQATS
jgi:biopolymer transport protein ExbB